MPFDPKLNEAGFPQSVVEYYIDGSDEGKFVWGTDDIRDGIKERIGNYLSNQTRNGHGNGFGPTQGNDQTIEPGSNEWTYRNEDGSPAALDLDAKGSSEPYAPQNGEGRPARLGNFLGFVRKNGIGSNLERIAIPGESENLLRDLEGTRGGMRTLGENEISETDLSDSDPKKTISQVLQNNRFNPRREESPFDPRGDRAHRDNLDTPILGYQSDLGRYDPNGEAITFEQLKKVGASLMLKATGEIEAGKIDPDSAAASVSLLPGVAQLGVVRPRSFQFADNAYGAPGARGGAGPNTNAEPNVNARPRVKSGDFDPNEPGGLVDKTSFGSYYSHLEPFEGDVIASRALAGALALVLVGGLKASQGALSLILGNAVESEKSKRRRAEIFQRFLIEEGGPISLGDSKRNLGRSSLRDTILPSFMPLPEEMNLHVPRHSHAGIGYFLTVERGLATLFNPLNVGVQPGFYITVSRNVIRDTVNLGQKIRTRVESGGSQSAGGAVNDVVGVVKDIVESSMVRMTNVLAQIGDATLLQDQALGRTGVAPGFILNFPPQDHVGIRDPGGRNSDSVIDSLQYSENSTTTGNAHIRAAKSRLRNGRLAWGTGQTPSMYLVPDIFSRGSDTTFGQIRPDNEDFAFSIVDAGKKSGDSPTEEIRTSNTPGSVGRLSSDHVEFIEDALDSEYMPFYFHDLRTNEIVSFYAFLTSLSDGYSVSYTNSDGYGRVDPVRIYQKTDRSIALSFHVAATNKQDFDEMWWKINKMTTLLYPQWSKGSLLKDGRKSTIQPFSQIPTATPVIRLRLGDIFKTNNSRFNLARLFGAGTDDFNPEGKALLANRAGFTELGKEESSFFSEDDNAIVKSFKSVAGRGLAGVITNMNFDWYSNTTWETTDIGARAPKMCKIDLQFAPIHDIAPGIDHQGFNRAPIYNVGKLTNAVVGAEIRPSSELNSSNIIRLPKETGPLVENGASPGARLALSSETAEQFVTKLDRETYGSFGQIVDSRDQRAILIEEG